MDRLRVGGVEIAALLDGELSLPLAQHFPETAPDAWTPYRERYPNAFEGEAWRTSLRFYLLRSERRTILVDAGFNDEQRGRWNVRGRPEGLRDAGLAPGEVDLVVLTHLHADHVGGTIDAEGRPRFRRHLIHRADLERARERAPQAPIFAQTVLRLEREGLLEAIDGERSIDDHVTLLHTPGHTPGSLSVLVSSDREKALLVGDAIHHPAQLAEPEWRDANDSDHAEAVRTRRALLERLEAEGLVLAPTHFPEPFGTVVRVDGRRVWRARA